MRSSKPPVQYLVGTPKGRLSALRASGVSGQPCNTARHGAQVKLLPQDGSSTSWRRARIACQETRDTRAGSSGPLERLHDLQRMSLTREALLMKLGAARAQSRVPGAWSRSRWPTTAQRSPIGSEGQASAGAAAEGRYLLGPT